MSDERSDNQELLAALRLTLVPGLGPRTRTVLLNRFGSSVAVLQAGIDELRSVSGVGKKLAQAVNERLSKSDAEQELTRCREMGVDLILQGDSLYPRSLSEICDPPEPLFCRGTLLADDQLAVAIVGARRCTLYGRQQAERLASGLARAGITVVSGLARGIDAVAHRAAMEAGGRTISVMATGLASVYPPEHADLADEIARQGCLLSESPLGQAPVPGLFPQRNRIISGLSLGVVIVEAARRSGALHTARHAMEQGREVFAVPGRIDSLASEACHDLIRDGVTLVRGVDDILEELGPLTQPVKRSDDKQVHVPRELKLNEQEREILDHVTLEPQHIDEILRNTEMESSRVLATITVLEMKRLIRRLPGGYLVRSTG
ncbi:MAG: DNA-protecting protein DprA [Planctomycetes bacterium]|nr:DNA-protecting protein DprA [Planctomycetota bacterium]